MDCIVRDSLRYLVRHGFSDLINQAGKLLAEVAGAESKVILFGSHARREAGPDSDVDFSLSSLLWRIVTRSGSVCAEPSETFRRR